MPLFKSDISTLLTAHPNETLYSIVSRLHAYWGYTLASKTNLILFGRVRGGYHHDLPSCLLEFCERTGNAYGNTADICLDRTLLRFYSRFISSSETANAIEVMSGTNVSHLKLRLGILTSRFRANHPLKSCASCVARDIQNMGTAYWHLEHQYPGVWWCTEHSELLVESEIKSNGVERFQWVLPNLHNKKVPVVERENLFELARLSKFISDFVNVLPLNFMDFSNVHLLYQNAFTDQGYIVGKRLKTIDAVASFQSYIRRFRGITELSSMMKSDEKIKSLLQTILREPRTRTHPVKHMLIMNWLFDCADQVQYQYVKLVDSNKQGFVFNSNQETQVFYDKNDDRRTRFQALVARINSKTLSLRAAAQEIGIDTSTALVWATQAGIQVTRRPKILNEDIRSKIVQKLRDGTSKEDIAETYVISIVTVTQILRTEIGLHQQWRESCLNIRREKARMEWTNLLKSNAALGSKFLRSLSPSTYAWLYRNDREWLVLNAPERISQLPENRKSVNWDERDFVLAQEVEHVALEIQLNIGSKKMMLWHLYQKIPELKAKLSNLSRLPLTRRTIDRVLKRKKIESTLDLTF